MVCDDKAAVVRNGSTTGVSVEVGCTPDELDRAWVVEVVVDSSSVAYSDDCSSCILWDGWFGISVVAPEDHVNAVVGPSISYLAIGGVERSYSVGGSSDMASTYPVDDVGGPPDIFDDGDFSVRCFCDLVDVVILLGRSVVV